MASSSSLLRLKQMWHSREIAIAEAGESIHAASGAVVAGAQTAIGDCSAAYASLSEYLTRVRLEYKHSCRASLRRRTKLLDLQVEELEDSALQLDVTSRFVCSGAPQIITDLHLLLDQYCTMLRVPLHTGSSLNLRKVELLVDLSAYLPRVTCDELEDAVRSCVFLCDDARVEEGLRVIVQEMPGYVRFPRVLGKCFDALWSLTRSNYAALLLSTRVVSVLVCLVPQTQFSALLSKLVTVLAVLCRKPAGLNALLECDGLHAVLTAMDQHQSDKGLAAAGCFAIECISPQLPPLLLPSEVDAWWLAVVPRLDTVFDKCGSDPLVSAALSAAVNAVNTMTALLTMKP